MKKLPEGWLHDDAARYLKKLVLSTAKLSGDLLEIGSWYGRSSIVIGLKAKKSGDKLYCIDTWNTKSWDTIAQGLPKDRRKYLWEDMDKNPLKTFISNIKAAGLENVVESLVGSSELFKEIWINPLKFIFIDGCHYYDFVREDAKWKEFLVVGGIIAFHDYTSGAWKDVKVAVDDEMDIDNRFEGIGEAQSIKAFMCRSKLQ